ncbi:MAG: alpha/beta hydrolase, partial [Clostridia bacterium]|nr:alpha/beta hydrolase [Clostridia bacterium]
CNLAIMDYDANDNYLVLEGEENIRSRAFSLLYSDGDEELLKSPYISPVFAREEQLRGFPPAVIVEAGLCPFVETNRKFGAKLEAAGTSVRFIRYPESRHGFTVRMNGAWQEAQQAIIDAINAAPPVE